MSFRKIFMLHSDWFHIFAPSIEITAKVLQSKRNILVHKICG